ncbi:MAG: hypothetical protein ACKVOO_03585 [Burkholderiaceae bacterium]
MAKRWSSREHPAVCRLCGRLSHVIASTGSGIPVASLFIAGAFVLLGAVLGLMPLGLVGIPVAVGYNIWAWKKAKLFPISGDSAATSRRVSWAINVLTFLGILGS